MPEFILNQGHFLNQVYYHDKVSIKSESIIVYFIL